MQGVRFARAGGAAALVDAADRPALAQDHRAAGKGFVVLGVTHTQARHIGDSVVQFHDE